MANVIGFTVLGLALFVSAYNYRVLIGRYLARKNKEHFTQSAVPVVCAVLFVMSSLILHFDLGIWFLPLLVALDPATFISLGYAVHCFLKRKIAR